MMGIDYHEDALTFQMPSDEDIRSIANLASMQLELEQRIEDVERELSELKKKHREIREIEIPEKMQLFNLKELKLADGTTLTIKPYYSASIKDDNREACFRWLRENGHGDIIKHIIGAQLGAGEDERAARLSEFLSANNYNYVDKEEVNAMTLKAFVKERIQSEDDSFPKELFNVYEGKQAVIKIPKGGR